MNCSSITIPKATCNGYERGARCMLPLIRCMEDEQRKKLDDVFKKDFQKLNLLLSRNGFRTCESLNMTSFKATTKNDESKYGDLTYDWDLQNVGSISNNDSNYEYHEYETNTPSNNGGSEADYFLPTQSSVLDLNQTRKTFRAHNKRKHIIEHRKNSKIII